MNNNKILIKFFSIIISIVDYKNKKKIISFFKRRFQNQILDIVDVGAHKGETIELLIKNFKVNKIFSFEPNKILFLNLKKKFYSQTKNIILFNKGLGEKKEIKKLNILIDSSSSTINNIDEDSKYFKRKQKIFSYFYKSKKIIQEQQDIEVERLSDIIKAQKINNINLLKIDTEGYELNVLKGIENDDYKKINFIYFEHHYDLMIKKKYKFSDINLFLKKRNFSLKYKLKMNLRKSFEYIYENSKK